MRINNLRVSPPTQGEAEKERGGGGRREGISGDGYEETTTATMMMRMMMMMTMMMTMMMRAVQHRGQWRTHRSFCREVCMSRAAL